MHFSFGWTRCILQIQAAVHLLGAWSSVTTEVIVNSFLVCGLSSNTYGSQDRQIHSLKPGQVAHSAADTIEKETARLNLATDVEADDPFADLDAGVHDEEEDEECMIDDE